MTAELTEAIYLLPQETGPDESDEQGALATVDEIISPERLESLLKKIEAKKDELSVIDEDMTTISNERELLLIKRRNHIEDISDGSLRALTKLKECDKDIESKDVLLAMCAKRRENPAADLYNLRCQHERMEKKLFDRDNIYGY